MCVQLDVWCECGLRVTCVQVVPDQKKRKLDVWQIFLFYNFRYKT